MGDDGDLPAAWAAVLHRFPGPVTLYPSRFKFAAAAIFFVFIVVMSAFVAWLAATEGDLGMVALGTVAALGFYAVVILDAAALNRNWMFMKLDTDGFEVRRPLKSMRYSWKDIDYFSTLSMSWVTVVTFHEAGRGAMAFKTIDTHGFRPDDLVKLMEAWQQRALALPHER